MKSQKITNKHGITFYELKSKKSLTGRFVFRQINKLTWVVATVNGQIPFEAKNAKEAEEKVLELI